MNLGEEAAVGSAGAGAQAQSSHMSLALLAFLQSSLSSPTHFSLK